MNGTRSAQEALDDAKRSLAWYKQDLSEYLEDLKETEAILSEAQVSSQAGESEALTRQPEELISLCQEHTASLKQSIAECRRQIPFLQTTIRQLELALEAEREADEVELREAQQAYWSSPEGQQKRREYQEAIARAQKTLAEIPIRREERRRELEEAEHVIGELERLKKEFDTE